MYDQDLYSLQATRQFGRFGFCRVRADFDSLQSQVRGQVVAGWTPNPGTAVYLGYDDDLRRDGFNPLTGAPEPGLVRTGRTLFLKLSYLLAPGVREARGAGSDCCSASQSRRPVALAEPAHFRQVSAVRHLAPLAAVVARRIEEQPAAARAAALLEPPDVVRAEECGGGERHRP